MDRDSKLIFEAYTLNGVETKQTVLKNVKLT